jgi:hypothetical protein
VSRLATAAIAVALRGSGGGRILRGVGGQPITPRHLADVWATLAPTSPCWAALAREAGVKIPSIEERARVIDELRSAS